MAIDLLPTLLAFIATMASWLAFNNSRKSNLHFHPLQAAVALEGLHSVPFFRIQTDEILLYLQIQ